ncbi:hypothetical protein A3F08_00810 [Candidatus Berkelbacteria bacterium RIFCSPHIGHO2_12_FULL_36_9]|uniref:Uncharacterized protein n=1 Tax=Candidatus Berkelbacteria bacterium RIFCSPHIGHO2_12_FULL_36_9 TaxID=1797469 RepID=A0A1F5EK13_9BACT|nr:MAG: hypothetical protein A3F08_00810 [Candidatus Berkelbacteria bacterium RIFCSPHIGHO2_12_FULL_36_9]
MNKILKTSLFNALGVAVYVGIVALLMENGLQLFGNLSGVSGIFVFLMLFVISAAVCGSLVFGKPVLMYLDGEKKEAVRLLTKTIAWLVLIVIITLIILSR